jgi:hypothetical protein
MENPKILVPQSLQETLWRLEEVRQGFRTKSAAQVKEALEWIASRQGLKDSYCSLFSPTPQDLSQGVRLPTGEQIKTKAAAMHILGEEALRTLIVWNLQPSASVAEALKGIDLIIERGGKTGSYCCYNCTIAFLRTLAVTGTDRADEILQKGLNTIRKARTADGRWRGYPFYYTLLFLSEINAPSVQEERKHAMKPAQQLLKRYRGNDRTSLFRRLALQSASNEV